MPRRKHLCLDDYDCIGFDLDHTLCRYNVGNLVPLVYDLLAEYLVKNKGYDKSIRNRKFSDDLHLMAKGLTLDCDRGNLLRLGCDGVVLTASHGNYLYSCTFSPNTRMIILLSAFRRKRVFFFLIKT